jgi:hypothetical protein
MDLPTESDLVPMYPQGPVMPSQSEPLGADVPPPQDFNGMNWSADPSQGGLGLAMSSPAMALPGGTPDWATALKGIGGALEGFSAGYFGRTPMFMQQQRLDQQKQQLDQMNAYRRDMVAGQIQARQEQKRMHDQKLFMTAMNSPRAMQMLETLGSDPNFSMAKQSQQARRVLKEADFNSLKAYKDFIPEEVQQKFMMGQLDDYELKAWVDEARVASQAEAKEKVKTASIQRAMNKQKNGENLSAYELQLINERQDAEDLKHADIRLRNAQADKALRDAEQGPEDKSEDNRVHMALHNGLTWAQGNNQTRQKALEYKYQGYAQGKRNVDLGNPVDKSAPLYRHPITGAQANPVRTPTELMGKGYVTVKPDQVGTLNQLTLVESALDDINQLGNKVLREATGYTFLDAPKGVMQMGVMGIKKKMAGNVDLERLDSAIQRIQAPMNRLQGDTANIAVAEREMLSKSIFKDADTVESLNGKIKDIKKSLASVKKQMGFRTREDYVRDWVKQGMSEEQIHGKLKELMQD